MNLKENIKRKRGIQEYGERFIINVMGKTRNSPVHEGA